MALFVLFSTLLVASATPTGFDKALLTRQSVSLDGLCGAYNGSATCAGSAFGNCCSQFGYCGSQPVYCGAGCQAGYGTCGVDTTLKWSNLGCFSDSTNARTLNAAINVAGNTVEKCQAACASAGYTMAGMEFGTQCFCGMGFNNKNAAPVDPSQCNAPCPGDASEICGGANALSLYTVQPVWQSMGCYSDSTNARTLTASINIAGNTVEKCQAACQANGYRYAGMEFGSQCFCGNSIGNGGAPVSSCAMPCPGDSTEVCGGSNALSLYYLYQ